MDNLSATLSIHFSPLIPEPFLIALAALLAIFCLSGYIKSKNGTTYRTLTACAFILILLNPSLIEQQRKPTKDVAVLVIDESASQNMQERSARTERAFQAIQAQLSRRDDIELRVVRAPSSGALANKTVLFENIEQILSDIPPKRRAGVIILSDGQIHDIPNIEGSFEKYGPVHLLLSGEKNEKDRRIEILEAPAYGITGKTITVKYRVIDHGNGDHSKNARVTLTKQQQDEQTLYVKTGEEQTLTLNIENAGQNIFELSVDGIPGEITMQNNTAGIIVQGIRDRLRVLLVSGQPYAGGRTWRDLLTSDPSVDLIHFTILRDPNKLDATPQDELSLIAFPFQELFEVKLYDFDLIIFDRYRLNRILPSYYFNNIVRYVEKGGALLVASGPYFAGKDSIYNTALMDVLPAMPTGQVFEEKYYPTVNKLGQQHPVTRSLVWAGTNANTEAEGDDQQSSNTHPWGPWLRQVNLQNTSGTTLMEGVNESPLLILDRVEDGRVAQIASDHLWLWSRGYEGGGPHAELMRRTVHWLMKEPQLDERALNITTSGDDILLKSIDLENKNAIITMTKPDGTQEKIKMEKRDDDIRQARVKADMLGIYGFLDGYNDRRFAVIGDLNPPELQAIVSTTEHMRHLMSATNGGHLWLEKQPEPSVRFLDKSRKNFARDESWIGLRQNREYTVQGVKNSPLLPTWLMLIALICLSTLTWWFEGHIRGRKK